MNKAHLLLFCWCVSVAAASEASSCQADETSQIAKHALSKDMQNVDDVAVELLQRGAALSSQEHRVMTKSRAAMLASAGHLDSEELNICFCTDDPDVQPLVVAINSTLINALEPWRLVFHVVTEPQMASNFSAALRAVLPSARIRIHHNASEQARIKSLIEGADRNSQRDSLVTPFNFASFYLDTFLGPWSRRKRLLYLDTDVLVTGDVGKLFTFDLGKHALAAVEDCSQHLKNYFDFDLLKKLGFDGKDLDPGACIVNRGVFIVDMPRWQEQRLTAEIELWMSRLFTSKEKLVHGGVSQPPWLLALHGRYQRLGLEWNCRGLGRFDFGEWEVKDLEVLERDLQLHRVTGHLNHLEPYVARCSANAKLLHFNGEKKPWFREGWGPHRPTLCEVPRGFRLAGKALQQSGDASFIECEELYRSYMSADAVAKLVDANEQQQERVAMLASAGHLDSEEFDICFCTDDPDVQPLVVAINSTLINALEPWRLVFHVVTEPQMASNLSAALRAVLPNARIRIHHNASEQARIKSLIEGAERNSKRGSLVTPFNFASFYLDAFLGPWSRRKRLLYLDTDVLVTGDVGKLFAFDLGNHALAAVEDCSQHFRNYIDFELLKKLGFERKGLEPDACIFNRGVFIVDMPRWHEQHLIAELELWMSRVFTSKEAFVHDGVSQPPWLLALHGRYQRLGREWNCRGMGRSYIGEWELEDSEVLERDLHLRRAGDQASHLEPYVAHCGPDAKIRHFNGDKKPWRRGGWGSHLPALCEVPRGFRLNGKAVKYSGDMSFIECEEIYRSYMSADAVAKIVDTSEQHQEQSPE